VRRKVTTSKVLDGRTIEGAQMAEALDALRCAVVLTNAPSCMLTAQRSTCSARVDCPPRDRDMGRLHQPRGWGRSKAPDETARRQAARSAQT